MDMWLRWRRGKRFLWRVVVVVGAVVALPFSDTLLFILCLFLGVCFTAPSEFNVSRYFRIAFIPYIRSAIIYIDIIVDSDIWPFILVGFPVFVFRWRLPVAYLIGVGVLLRWDRMLSID
jgi:hypothetical protein